MMRSTLGAPWGGTMRGGHQGVESLALSLITPPNFDGGAGSCFPSMVVVASAEPNVPVTCCAAAVATDSVAVNRNTAKKFEMVPVPSAGIRIPAARAIRSLLTARSLYSACRSSLPLVGLSELFVYLGG